MTTPAYRSPLTRAGILGAALALLVACSAPAPSPRIATPAPATTRPTSATTSAGPTKQATDFCRNLELFDLSTTAYRAEASLPVRDQPLDTHEVHRLAGVVARTGEPMVAAAPKVVADELRVLLDAVVTSAANLDKPRARVIDVVRPVVNDKVDAAAEALRDFRGCG